MKYDYSFFESSLQRLRKLRAYSVGKAYLIDAPHQIFPDLDLGVAPELLSEGSESWVALTRSYARMPGNDLYKLKKIVHTQLPEDFMEFHQMYDEALVTTRTYPIHLWKEDRILEEIKLWRDDSDHPLRFFRFGQYWDSYGLYFGLWQQDPINNAWRVVIASHSERDDELDEYVEDEFVLGSSFIEWLESWIERDGLPDPYKPDFGILDPA